MRVKPCLELMYRNPEPAGMGRLTLAARLTNSRGTPWRALEAYALVFLTRGGGLYRDGRGTETRLRAGDAFLLYPGIHHAYGPEPHGAWDEVHLLFEGSVFDLWREQRWLDPDRPIRHLGPVEAWEQRLQAVCHPSALPLEQLCRLQLLLADMLREDPSDREENGAWLDRALCLLDEMADRPGAIRATAKILGMSYERFRKRFRQAHGIPPGRHLEQILIHRAARQLAGGGLPIKQIAYALGYCDEFYFSRRFKSLMGQSPASYRRAKRVSAP